MLFLFALTCKAKEKDALWEELGLVGCACGRGSGGGVGRVSVARALPCLPSCRHDREYIEPSSLRPTGRHRQMVKDGHVDRIDGPAVVVNEEEIAKTGNSLGVFLHKPVTQYLLLHKPVNCSSNS